MTDRAQQAAGFLRACGWGDATARHLAGDASDRRYTRLLGDGKSALLMDSPLGKADDPRDFIKIATHLRDIGLSAPMIYESDLAQGFLLIEDFGDGVFAKIIADDRNLEPVLYADAVDVLAHLQSHPPAHGLPDLSAGQWADAAALCLDFYATDAPAEMRAAFVGVLCGLIEKWADAPRVMILRDYHAENLMLLPDRTGLARVGLLDFQLGQMGQRGYDFVSLVQDARRDVGAGLARDLTERFARATGVDLAGLETSLAVLGAQRALRILGVFARLAKVSGKRGYLQLMPRVWGQLWQNLNHPALHDLVPLCRHLPEPSGAVLQRIADGN